MHQLIKYTLILISTLGCSSLFGQSAQFPIVKEYGGIYEIPDATERPDSTLTYKLLVDLSTAAEDNKQISR